MNCLTPEQGNIHRITALENTAFLDILLPNYNETDRICNFYKEVYEEEMSEEKKSEEKAGQAGNTEMEKDQKNGCLELKINKTGSKQEISDSVPIAMKGKKAKQPGDATTLLYVLPTFEQPISVIEYKGEKFDYESHSTQEFNVQNP